MEFTWNQRFRPGASQEVHVVHATRLVVLSAGAFGSPGILERSGIGKADLLKEMNLEVKVDLPGVGEGYQGGLPSYQRSGMASQSFFRPQSFYI